MRGYMQGALGALFAYGAAWWSAGERAVAPIEKGVRAGALAAYADEPSPAQTPVVARAGATAPNAQVSAPAAQVPAVGPVQSPPRERVGGGAHDPLAGIAALPGDFSAAGNVAATQESLRQLAEYRQLAESPAALVERVERFEPTPAQLAEFRRVAAQLFNARPAGAEGESPWASGGTRDGQGSLVRRSEQSATRERSAR